MNFEIIELKQLNIDEGPSVFNVSLIFENCKDSQRLVEFIEGGLHSKITNHGQYYKHNSYFVIFTVSCSTVELHGMLHEISCV